MGTHIRNRPRPSRSERPPQRGSERSFGELVASQAEDLFNRQLAARFHKPADDLAALATALRQTQQRFEGDLGARYVQGIAERLDRTASLLKRADARELVSSIERFARSEPLLFMSAALGLGISAGRFFKSSAQTHESAPRSERISSPTSKSKPS